MPNFGRQLRASAAPAPRAARFVGIGCAAALSCAAPSPRSPASPSVWVIDDGEKIRRDDVSTPYERGEHNPVWRPGEPVRLFAMRDESIALQVVVEAGDVALDGVTVSFGRMEGPGGAHLPEGDVQRFVEHFVVVRRPSGGRTPGESLGWSAGAGPRPGEWVGPVPDALVPIEDAAPWVAYPMRVAPRTNGIVWIDVRVPSDQPAGAYRGRLEVRGAGRALASIPVELSIAPVVLPDDLGPTGRATVYYDPDELRRRVGPGAEESLWKLLHAHRIAPLHDATSPQDVARQRDALDGRLYTRARGYAGPGEGAGDGVLSLGAYGALGAPDAASLARVEAVADAVAAAHLFDSCDVFLYAADEQCSSAWGARWRALLRGAADPNARRVLVGWTCSDDPASQPVDVVMRLASYDAARARRAARSGRRVWVYNGVLPRSGTFLLDAPAVSPRVNGWLAGMFGVARWFYWESTYWYGRRGDRPIDPYAEPESLHNAGGDWANGDGVLVYPGRQIDAFREHSLGVDGVFPSIRLKNWRRGLEDAGYLALARARDAKRADAVARSLVPSAFADARDGAPPSWSPRGDAFFEARRQLLAIILGEAPPSPAPRASGRRGSDWAAVAVGVTLLAALAALAAVGADLWRRDRG